MKNNINKLKLIKENIKITIAKIKDEKIILKTPVKNYSWDDLKILSSI